MGDDVELYIEMQKSGFWDWIEEYNENKSMTIEKYERYFFVDYENVNIEGLNGIMKLSNRDCVRIYYSSSAETLTFGLHKRINASMAQFDYIKVQMPIRNAIDCQILFDIKDLTKMNKNTEYFIVSKDKDYDKAIEEFNIHNFKVSKLHEISKVNEFKDQKQLKILKQQPKKQSKNTFTDNKIRESQIRSFFGQNFKKKEYTKHKEDIIEIILNAKTKQQVNNNLMKFYKSEIVSEIYKKLQPLIRELPGK